MFFKRLLLVLFLISIPELVQSKEPIRIATGEWSPYISEHAKNGGVLVQVAKEAFALEGIEVKFYFYPWRRVYQLGSKGVYDAVLGYTKTKEREKFFYFSDEIYTGKYVFFHKKERPMSWESFEDIGHLTLATTRGFGGMGDRFLSAEKSNVLRVLRLNSDIQSFNMVYINRADAVPSDLEVGYTLLGSKLTKEQFDQFTHNPRVIHNPDYHLGIPKINHTSKGLLYSFNRGLRKLKKSGRYGQIIKKYKSNRAYRTFVLKNTK